MEGLFHFFVSFAQMCQGLYENRNLLTGSAWIICLAIVAIIGRFIMDIFPPDHSSPGRTYSSKPPPVRDHKENEPRKPIVTPMFTENVLKSEKICKVSLFPKSKIRHIQVNPSTETS